MSSFAINNIQPFVDFEANSNYLLLLAIDKTPPHLALVSSGKYFSVSSRGVKLGVDAGLILNSLTRKKVSSILIELSIDLSWTTINMEFSKFECLKNGQSCLLPILGSLATYDNSIRDAKFVFELIPILQQKRWMRNIYSIAYNEPSFTMKKYGQNEIDLAIKNAAQLC